MENKCEKTYLFQNVSQKIRTTYRKTNCKQIPMSQNWFLRHNSRLVFIIISKEKADNFATCHFFYHQPQNNLLPSACVIFGRWVSFQNVRRYFFNIAIVIPMFRVRTHEPVFCVFNIYRSLIWDGPGTYLS